MVKKHRIDRLERATRAGREQEALREVFANYMDRLDALVAGEPPPPHPRAAALGAGTFFDGSPIVIKGTDGPVPDLSEP